jgi:hypothetical protein
MAMMLCTRGFVWRETLANGEVYETQSLVQLREARSRAPLRERSLPAPRARDPVHKHDRVRCRRSRQPFSRHRLSHAAQLQLARILAEPVMRDGLEVPCLLVGAVGADTIQITEVHGPGPRARRGVDYVKPDAEHRAWLLQARSSSVRPALSARLL